MTTLLLVDDSDTVLNYEQAVLGGLYTCLTAVNGLDALERLRVARVDVVLLDLSMPELDGEGVLEQMQQHEAWRDIPVIVCSSEEERARQLLGKGASAMLVKPLRESDLRKAVAGVLEERERVARTSVTATLPMRIGKTVFGVPLDSVRAVELMPRTRPLGVGAARVTEVADFHGALVPVLDVSRVLRIAHDAPLHERKLVIIRDGAQLLGLTVDAVRDPIEVTADHVQAVADFVGDKRLASRVLRAVATTEQGLLPIVDPTMFFSRAHLHRVRRALSAEAQTPLA